MSPIVAKLPYTEVGAEASQIMNQTHWTSLSGAFSRGLRLFSLQKGHLFPAWKRFWLTSLLITREPFEEDDGSGKFGFIKATNHRTGSLPGLAGWHAGWGITLSCVWRRKLWVTFLTSAQARSKGYTMFCVLLSLRTLLAHAMHHPPTLVWEVRHKKLLRRSI